MAAQQRLQILVQHIAAKQEARMTEHQAEQPDDLAGTGRIGEVDDEARKVDLRLDARRRLKAHFVEFGPIIGSDCSEVALHRGIAAGIAHLADLARQPHCGEVGEGSHPLMQIGEIGRQFARPTDGARSIGRRLDATLDIFAYGLGIAPRAPGNRGDRQTLPV